MFKPKTVRLNNPEFATVGDCLLLMQMGYDVNIQDGRVVSVTRARRCRS